MPPSQRSGERSGLQQLRTLTAAARWRHGIGAVAPALEPYVDATHWPSGAPLPLCITAAARRCRRRPKAMASLRIALIYIFLAATFGAAICASMYGWVEGLQCSRGGLSIGVRAVLLVLLFCTPFALMYWAMVRSDVRAHTIALAVVLYLDKAGPDVRGQLLGNFDFAVGCVTRAGNIMGQHPDLDTLFPLATITA